MGAPDGDGGMYLVMLLIGAVIVIADGQVILRHAPGYLVEAYHDPRRARQVAGLVGLMFHLVMLGVTLLLISGMVPHPTVPAVLRRLGILLIVTAIGHAVTMVLLSRLREQQTSTDMAHAQMDAAASAEPRAPNAAEVPVESPVPPAPPPARASRSERARRAIRAVRPR